MDVDAEVAARTVESVLPGSVFDVEQKLSRHIAVEHDSEDVVLSVDDGDRGVLAISTSIRVRPLSFFLFFFLFF